jgi:hypothetical protein
MTNDPMPPVFASLFFSRAVEFSSRLAFLKFELKNLEWDGKVLKSGVSRLKVQQHVSPCPSKKRSKK